MIIAFWCAWQNTTYADVWNAVEGQIVPFIVTTVVAGLVTYLGLSVLPHGFTAIGPMSLLTTALAGLIFLLSIFIQELVSYSGRLAKQRLDMLDANSDYSSQIPRSFQQSLRSILQAYSNASQIQNVSDQGMIADHQEISTLLRKLEPCRNKNASFCLLMSGENNSTSASQEAFALAQSYARKGLMTLLVDTYNMPDNVSYCMEAQYHLGFYELINTPTCIGTVIQSDPDSALQFVASGLGTHTFLTEGQKNNLNQVFAAWSHVYDVIIINVQAHKVAQFYEDLNAQPSAGIFIQHGHRPAPDSVALTFMDIAATFNIILHQKPIQYEPPYQMLSDRPTTKRAYH